ncbi:hypothetical protein [Prosthecobacter sp.]|uniref:hypothetical protein n=1 Tax=Prosthecobacter sp. TaxID=1965333 RepID=UPI0037834FA2
MNRPDHRRSRWWADVIMMLLIATCTFCIFVAGGHGAGFLWQILTERFADTLCSPWGLSLWAALLLPASSFLPFRAAAVLRWLALLLLTGFFIYLSMMTERSEWTLKTSVPLLLVSLIQLARTFRLQQQSPTPASSSHE